MALHNSLDWSFGERVMALILKVVLPIKASFFKNLKAAALDFINGILPQSRSLRIVYL